MCASVSCMCVATALTQCQEVVGVAAEVVEVAVLAGQTMNTVSCLCLAVGKFLYLIAV